jgi:hypothetical protein
MIHRIDRVNPDVDDRVIKPNEAREAINLRFGASTDDENLSGGTLFLGNEEVFFVFPGGTNTCVGIYADYENRFVFFAMYNDLGNHGIYRINSLNNDVKAIVSGAWLNFVLTYADGSPYNVSMTSIDGKLYWTDDFNPPRMVNVEKGIRTEKYKNGDLTQVDIYPLVVEQWHYTQLKRPPGMALQVLLANQIEEVLEDVSLTKRNRSQTDTGFQYSYYYVYDNYEESRLAPYSINTYGNYNIQLTIPAAEFTTYVANNNLVYAVVVVIRNGNDGVWREIRYAKNDGSLTGTFTFQNIQAASKTLVDSDITDARFDSVPLISKTNEIAQNRVIHGNYLLDYEAVSGITFTAKFVNTFPDAFNLNDPKNRRSFVPWGRYSFGVEFVDIYGRTIPVISTSDQYAGPWEPFDDIRGLEAPKPGEAADLIYTNSQNTEFDNAFGRYSAEYSIKGALPSWVDRVNIVRSKCKNIIQMNQSVSLMYLWYRGPDNTDEFFTFVSFPINPQWSGGNQSEQPDLYNIWDKNNVPKKYTFMGYAIRFNSGEPFTQKDNQYVYIRPTYRYTGSTLIGGGGSNLDVYYQAKYVKYKVAEIRGSLILINKNDGIYIHPNAVNDPNFFDQQDLFLSPQSYPISCLNTIGKNSDIESYIQLLYNVILTTEGNVDDDTLYVTENSYSRADYERILQQKNEVRGELLGDCRFSLPLRTYVGGQVDIKIYDAGTPVDKKNPDSVIKSVVQRIPAQGWYGFFISMSPIDIWRPQWNQNIGQVNTTNYKQGNTRRLTSALCFSNPLIQGSQVNGINKFNSLDFRQAPAENGPITDLVATNATQREPGVLLAIGTFGINSFYYDAIQLTNVDGSSNVTTTDAFLASQRPLLGQLGTSRQMSVTKTPLGTVYWWSDVVNDMIRYSNAGLERLGLTFSFSNFLRKEYNDDPLIISWYDQMTDEISFLGIKSTTSTFSERFKTFQGTRDYTTPTGEYPERAMGIATKMYHILQGKIWVTDIENSLVPKNFLFGEFKNPDLTIVTNESPVSVKRWNQIKIFGDKPTETNLSTSGFPAMARDSLTSYIDSNWWIQRKGDWEAAIRRADNTIGGVMGGKLMESRILYSNFAFTAQGFEKINFIEVRSNVSIVQ